MKKTILILSFVLPVTLCIAQSVTLCPLNLSTINGYARLYSTPSHDVVWTGIEGAYPSWNCKNFAISTNAGLTFRVGTIPDTADRGCACIWALDSLTAWIGLSDYSANHGGAIWKTTDGGNSWTCQTTANQFSGPGAYVDYIAFFTPDSGVAFGNLNGGYYEIYTTVNGGSTWTRVPVNNIPSAIPNEAGDYANLMSVVGNSIWCPTWNGRVYFSTDRGYTWQVSTIQTGYTQVTSDLSMSDSMLGAAVEPPLGPQIFLTLDGGYTWNTKQMTNGLEPFRICRIPWITGSFVFFSGQGIYVTTDTFSTSYPIIANLSNLQTWMLTMYDATVGWACPNTAFTDSGIFKIESVITGIREPASNNEASLSVLPNPVQTDYALVSWKADDARIKDLALYDMNGRLLRRQSVKNTSGTQAKVFDFSGLVPGVYMLQLDGKSASTVRVVISPH